MQNVIKVYYQKKPLQESNTPHATNNAQLKEVHIKKRNPTECNAKDYSLNTSQHVYRINSTQTAIKENRPRDTQRGNIINVLKKLQSKNKAVIILKDLITQHIRIYFKELLDAHCSEAINFTNLLLGCADNSNYELKRKDEYCEGSTVKLSEILAEAKRASISTKSKPTSNVSTIKGLSISSFDERVNEISKQETKFNPLLSTYSEEARASQISLSHNNGSFYEPKTQRYEAYSPKKIRESEKSGNVSLVEFARDSVSDTYAHTRTITALQPQGAMSIRDVNPTLLSQSRDKRESSKRVACSRDGKKELRRLSWMKSEDENENCVETITHRTTSSSKDRLLTAHFKEEANL
jgi:hypothetical protein